MTDFVGRLLGRPQQQRLRPAPRPLFDAGAPVLRAADGVGGLAVRLSGASADVDTAVRRPGAVSAVAPAPVGEPARSRPRVREPLPARPSGNVHGPQATVASDRALTPAEAAVATAAGHATAAARRAAKSAMTAPEPTGMPTVPEVSAAAAAADRNLPSPPEACGLAGIVRSAPVVPAAAYRQVRASHLVRPTGGSRLSVGLEPAQAAAPASERVVRVTIDRVEVRATAPEKPAATRSAARRPALGLDEYLRGRG